MELTINGEVKIFKEKSGSLNLSEVLQKLALHPQTIVVEFNGVILNPEMWKEQKVVEGDRIEIVTIVGGGA